MILFEFGLPGRFTEWCAAAVTRLAERRFGPVIAIAPGGAEELAIALVREERANLLVNEYQPGLWLRRVLFGAGRPLLLSLDDPRRAIWELVSSHGLPLAEAIRQVGSSCALIMPCLALRDVLVLHAERDWHTPEVAIEAIARHFGVAAEPAEIKGIVAELVAAGFDPGSDRAAWEPERFGEPDLTIVNGAVNGYLDYFLGTAMGPITWFRELFFTDDAQPAIHPIDIGGRARALIYGPYFRLPPGSWVAEVVLGFSQEAADLTFAIDVKTGDAVLSATNIRPVQQGIFSVPLNFVVSEENEHPIEFRIMNERAAFDGRVMLGNVSLSLHQDRSNAAIDRVKAELGLPS